MHSLKKVSVIWIIDEKLSDEQLRETADSINKQSLEDIEVVYVNVVSRKKCQELFAGKMDAIEIWSDNLAEGLNRAVKTAHGEYIGFLSGKDRYIKDAYENMYEKAKLYNADMVKTGTVFVNDTTKEVMIKKEYGQIRNDLFDNKVRYSQYPEILATLPVEIRGTIYRKEFLERRDINFVNIEEAEEVAFSCEVLLKAESIVISRIKTVYHIISENKEEILKINTFCRLFEVYDRLDELCDSIMVEAKAEMLNRLLEHIFSKYIQIKKSDLNGNIRERLIDFLGRIDLKLIYTNVKTIRWLKQYQKLLQDAIGATQDENRIEELKGRYLAVPFYSLAWRRSYTYATSLKQDEYEDYLKDWYFARTGVSFEFENVRTYGEKIQWLKLYDTTPLKIKLSDKVEARSWVRDTIGEKYLVPLLGMWDCFDDIDFDNLPEQFVLKTNHGFHTNLIVKSKKNIDMLKAKHMYDAYIKINFAFLDGIEPYYMDIKPKIIAEEYLGAPEDGLFNCSFFCFNGVPKYVWIRRYDFNENMSDPWQSKESVYDMEWNFQDFTVVYPRLNIPMQQPVCFEEMRTLAEKMCQEFSHVRVDFVYIKDRIYFSEMTFGTANGIIWDFDENGKRARSISANRIFGDMLRLPEKKSLPDRKTPYQYGKVERVFGELTPEPKNPFRRS